MRCPNCESKLSRDEAWKVALSNETVCQSCNSTVYLGSGMHRYVVIALIFGCAILVGIMTRSEGGDFLMGHLLGFFLGAVLASAYLQLFGRLSAK